jgi:hypothetical protein
MLAHRLADACRIRREEPAVDPTEMTAISQANVQIEIQMALARKTMDIRKQQGQQLAQLLEGAAVLAEPAREPGKGAQVDVPA